jgi:hypothetical protein
MEGADIAILPTERPLFELDDGGATSLIAAPFNVFVLVLDAKIISLCCDTGCVTLELSMLAIHE